MTNKSVLPVEVIDYIEFLVENANKFISDEVRKVFTEFSEIMQNVIKGKEDYLISDESFKIHISLLNSLNLPDTIFSLKNMVPEYYIRFQTVNLVDNRQIIGEYLETGREDISEIREIVFRNKMRIYKSRMYKLKKQIKEILEAQKILDYIDVDKLFRRLKLSNF